MKHLPWKLVIDLYYTSTPHYTSFLHPGVAKAITYNQVVTQVYAWLRTYSTLELALRIGVCSTDATCSRATQPSIHCNIKREWMDTVKYYFTSGWKDGKSVLLPWYFVRPVSSLNHCCAGISCPVATQDLQDMRHCLKLTIYPSLCLKRVNHLTDQLTPSLFSTHCSGTTSTVFSFTKCTT